MAGKDKTNIGLLYTLGKSLANFNDFEELVADICNNLQKIFNSKYIILFFEKDGGKGMVPVYWEGIEWVPAENSRISRRQKFWQMMQRIRSLKIIKQIDPRSKRFFSVHILKLENILNDNDVLFPLTINKEVVGAIVIGDSKLPASNELRKIVAGFRESAGIALSQTLTVQRLYREKREKELLLEVSKRISSTLKLNKVLDLIIDQMRTVVPYDKAALMLLDNKTGKLKYQVYRIPPKYSNPKFSLKLSEGLSGWSARKGHSVIVPDVRKDTRYVNLFSDTRSELVVPIKFGKKVIGVFNLESNELNTYNYENKELVKALAGQAAISLRNAMLYEEMLQKRKLEHEMEMAARIQQALLPKRLPVLQDFELAAINVPSRTVGGDLYDFIQFANGRVGITIGDVAGKGAPGAIIMATLFASYRGLVRAGMKVAAMIYELNNVLTESITTGSFATFFFGVLNPDNKEFYYVNAGHNPPVLLHEDNSWDYLQEGGTVLGFMKGLEYKRGFVKLKPGDLLFLYTDGVTEARNKNNNMFEDSRLLKFLKENKHEHATKFLQKLLKRIQVFSGKKHLADDVTMLVIKVKN